MSPAKRQSILQEAVALHRAGRLEAAETLYRQVRVAKPLDFDALHLSGLLAHQQGRAAQAVELLEKAHGLDRSSSVCEMRLGAALLAAGRPADAEQRLRRVTARDPRAAEAWDQLAYCLKMQDRLAEAVACHQKAVAASARSAVLWCNYGLTLALQGELEAALTCQERALALEANLASARLARAQVLHRLKRIPEAIEDYDRVLTAEPADAEARSCRLMVLQCVDGLSREWLFEEHAAFGRMLGAPPSRTFANERDPARRLKVAVWSPDLREHSCAYFFEPLLEYLDEREFEVWLYHDHFREDEVSARLRSRGARWRNLVGQTHAAVEATLLADAPDILIDLAGHTGMCNRLPVFARRVAPVQVTYLGYPDTTGVAAMDYRFTDAIADPPGDAEPFATEQLVRFAPVAWSYRPPVAAPMPRERRLPGPVTFGSFNDLAKITERVLALWARVLAEVPASRLLIKGEGLGESAIRDGWLTRFRRAGLPVERLELVGRLPDPAAHLALYRNVDVALDTFPYQGTTTTCEALWMGVPVVALAGDRHAARVGVSLLHAVGHPEWVASDENEYVRTAAQLAADPVDPASVRTAMQRSPLLDHAAQAARFGAALRACWVNGCERSASASHEAVR